ncbi:MAG TPA: YjbE family putative metal transport protein [Anaeromyxobacter sp.]|nr:YjbE family putative metal transport protein [Anaeromyxobacter sp.]
MRYHLAVHLAAFDAAFWAGLASVVLIDIALAGDNAVVIAMAARPLAGPARRRAIVLGAGAAVVLRVLLTFFVAQLLGVAGVRLGGGLLILWVAVKLLAADEEADAGGASAVGTWQAIRLIVIADLSMSLDNMLAVGGASHGDLRLLVLGLGLSIPLVVIAADLLARVMARFPVIAYAGAAILGKVGAEMIATDPLTAARLPLAPAALHAVEAVAAGAVVAAGLSWSRLRRGRRAR